MKYRSEIDGLRALAVLPVMFFHAGFTTLSGGFLGVDVFFVISGYLITGIILNDIAKGDFSIARFYERRARRILPALFTVLFASSVFAFVWMIPSQYAEFSRSIIAVVLFVSNLFFWRESGYFAAEAAQKPLLHTWSLGVEEQFYLLFPLALVLLWRFGKRFTFVSILVVGIASLALCQLASTMAPSANFFLLPTRAWELMAGAICAFLHHDKAPRKHQGLSLLGLGLIIYAILFYAEHMPLPSLYNLTPVVGTTLILLFATPDTPVGRLLSLRPVVAVGLISYSAYLWHQPIFAFARIQMQDAANPLFLLGLIALSLLLAALSWYYVEQPFRKKQHRFYVGGRKGLALAILAATILCAIGIHGHITQGRLEYWKAQATPAQRAAFELMQHEQQRSFTYDNGACVFNVNRLTAQDEERILGCSKRYGPGIAVIGDSHAMNLFHVLKAKAGDTQFMVGLAQGMCRPDTPLPTCNYAPFAKLLAREPKLFRDVIYEQAGWETLVDRFGRPIQQGAFSGLPLDAPVEAMAPNHESILAARTYLEDVARHTRVTWLGPRIEPEISEHVIVKLGCDYPFTLRPQQEERFTMLDKTIATALTESDIRYVSQIDLMDFDMQQDFMTCDATYWKDRNHYSEAGEMRFGQRITLDTVLAP